MAPGYLADLLKPDQSRKPGLRSQNTTGVLHVLFTRRKTFADRSCSVFGPKTWNSLPNTLRTNMDYGKFRSGLKAHLFANAYPDEQHLLEKGTNDNIYFVYLALYKFTNCIVLYNIIHYIPWILQIDHLLDPLERSSCTSWHQRRGQTWPLQQRHMMLGACNEHYISQ